MAMALTAAQKNTVRQTAVQYCGSVKSVAKLSMPTNRVDVPNGSVAVTASSTARNAGSRKKTTVRMSCGAISSIGNSLPGNIVRRSMDGRQAAEAGAGAPGKGMRFSKALCTGKRFYHGIAARMGIGQHVGGGGAAGDRFFPSGFDDGAYLRHSGQADAAGIGGHRQAGELFDPDIGAGRFVVEPVRNILLVAGMGHRHI